MVSHHDLYNQWVQVTPNLVVWPGSELDILIALESGSHTQLAVPLDAVRFLKRFSSPQEIAEIVRLVGKEAMKPIEDSLSEGWLRTSDVKIGLTSPYPSRWAGFRLIDSTCEEAYKSYTRREIRLICGSEIIIIDDFCDDRWAFALYRWLFQLRYQQLESDVPEARAIRHWKCGILKAIDTAGLVPWFQRIDAEVRRCAFPAQLALTRIHAYAVSYGDVQLAHTDIESGSGITAVFFGNPSWQDAWGSEMLFYEDGEPTVAVQPRPKRLVIFPAEVVHKAGVPSKLCHDPRFTLVFKYDVACER